MNKHGYTLNADKTVQPATASEIEQNNAVRIAQKQSRKDSKKKRELKAEEEDDINLAVPLPLDPGVTVPGPAPKSKSRAKHSSSKKHSGEKHKSVYGSDCKEKYLKHKMPVKLVLSSGLDMVSKSECTLVNMSNSENNCVTHPSIQTQEFYLSRKLCSGNLCDQQPVRSPPPSMPLKNFSPISDVSNSFYQQHINDPSFSCANYDGLISNCKTSDLALFKDDSALPLQEILSLSSLKSEKGLEAVDSIVPTVFSAGAMRDQSAMPVNTIVTETVVESPGFEIIEELSIIRPSARPVKNIVNKTVVESPGIEIINALSIIKLVKFGPDFALLSPIPDKIVHNVNDDDWKYTPLSDNSPPEKVVKLPSPVLFASHVPLLPGQVPKSFVSIGDSLPRYAPQSKNKKDIRLIKKSPLIKRSSKSIPSVKAKNATPLGKKPKAATLTSSRLVSKAKSYIFPPVKLNSAQIKNAQKVNQRFKKPLISKTKKDTSSKSKHNSSSSWKPRVPIPNPALPLSNTVVHPPHVSTFLIDLDVTCPPKKKHCISEVVSTLPITSDLIMDTTPPPILSSSILSPLVILPVSIQAPVMDTDIPVYTPGLPGNGTIYKGPRYLPTKINKGKNKNVSHDQSISMPGLRPTVLCPVLWLSDRDITDFLEIQPLPWKMVDILPQACEYFPTSNIDSLYCRLSTFLNMCRIAGQMILYTSQDARCALSNVNQLPDIIMYIDSTLFSNMINIYAYLSPLDVYKHGVNNSSALLKEGMSSGQWISACEWVFDLIQHVSFPLHINEYRATITQTEDSDNKLAALQSTLGAFKFIAQNLRNTVSDFMVQGVTYVPLNVSFLTRIQRSSLGIYVPS